MKWIVHDIHVGAAEPFTALHVSDTHFSYADERDPDKIDNARVRHARHGVNQVALLSAAAYCKAHGCPMFHTGDMIDFISLANLDKARAFMQENDCFFTPGNHEYAGRGGKENAATQARLHDLVQSAFTNDIRFAMKQLHGVNFVAVNNSFHRMDAGQLAQLRAVVAQELPVVLLMHVPLFTQAQYDLAMRGDSSAYLMAVPEELTASYPPEDLEKQAADADTYAAYDYIVHEPAIKAILTGHQHFDLDDPVTRTLTQYVIDRGTVHEIHFT